MQVRAVVSEEASVIRLVGARMRETLIEVLGRERGEAMYTPAWLEDRVRAHLDPGRLGGGVFVVEGERGAVLGHVIVREEPDEAGPLGLVSTIWVQPEARRTGVASALLDAAEGWAAARGLGRTATHTAVDNRPLHRLLEGRGYRIDLVDGEMLRLIRGAGS